MVKDPRTGKGKMLQALLDSGCTKSIILKSFTSPKERKQLSKKDCCRYETYGGHFTSNSTANVVFRMIEFHKNKDLLINYTFQVDEVNKTKDSRYDMIVGNDILHDLGIDLMFSEEKIQWKNKNTPFDNNSIPMKTLGTLSDLKTCTMIYDLHTISPILQQEEDRQRRILDADYSKVDIDSMVNDLDIAKATKKKLKQTLNKFPTLFGGGLGLLDIKPVDIELRPGSKPHASQYYTIPRAYDKVAKDEINQLVTVDVLNRLDHANNSPWASPSFCQMKKTMTFVSLLISEK